jgi:hypothetical protein
MEHGTPVLNEAKLYDLVQDRIRVVASTPAHADPK